MSVTVTEEYSGQSTSASIAGGVLDKQYTRRFIVIASDNNVGPLAVREAAGIPAYGASYSFGSESDSFAFVVSKSAERDGDSLKWVVTVNYSCDYDPLYNNINPLLNLPKPSWSGAKYEREIIQDKEGNLITNSALDPLDPGVNQDDSRLILTIQHNRATFNYPLAHKLRDTTNLNKWYQFEPNTVKLQSITCSEPLWSGIVGRYYSVVFSFEFHVENWNAKPVDAGTRQLVPIGGGAYTWKNIETQNGQTNAVSLLDGNGSPLAPDPLNPFNCTFLEFKTYNQVDFKLFAFPATMDLGMGPGV